MSLFSLLNQPLNATLFILPLVPLLRHSLLLVPRRLLFRLHLTLNPLPLFVYNPELAALKSVKEVSGILQNETKPCAVCYLGYITKIKCFDPISRPRAPQKLQLIHCY